MHSLRQNDKSSHKTYQRSDRLFELSGLWYFRTREGRDIGPFRYESEARQMLMHFIDDLKVAAASYNIREKSHLRPDVITNIRANDVLHAGLDNR
jgi:hypothetical protein